MALEKNVRDMKKVLKRSLGVVVVLVFLMCLEWFISGSIIEGVRFVGFMIGIIGAMGLVATILVWSFSD